MDYDAFHRYLFALTDEYDETSIRQDELAATFLLTKGRISQILTEFEIQGRIVRLNRRGVAAKLKVIDPDFWTQPLNAQE